MDNNKAEELKLTDEDLLKLDRIVYGTSFEKGGKRIDPHDVYLETVTIPSSTVKQVVGILDLCVKMPGLTSAIRAQEALALLQPYVKETV